MLGASLGLIVGMPFGVRLARRRDAVSAGWAMVLASSPPFIVLAWALVVRGRGEGIALGAPWWASQGMWALAVAGAIAMGALLWRNGEQPGFAGLLMVTILGALTLLYVLFVGGMLITNTWL